MARVARSLLVALLVAGVAASAARATPRVRMKASLTPERLGSGTTVGFGFDVVTHANEVPPPITAIELRYPANLGFALSGIGLQTCAAPATPEVVHPLECPLDAVMGTGEVLAELEVESLRVKEPAHVTIYRGPNRKGHLALLFYAEGGSPVSAQIVFPGLLLPASGPFGGAIAIHVPAVHSWPESPALSIVRLRASVGPEHLTYIRHIGGRIVSYVPRGILLPRRCPRGGFRFVGRFHFADGSHTSAKAVVPCPAGSAGGRG